MSGARASGGSWPIRYVNDEGCNVAYSVLGDGDVDIVLVPAFVTHLEMLADLPACRRFMERLASFGRVIVVEKRGTGLSDPVDHTPTVEEWVSDVLAVMDAEGSTRAAVVGASEGGTTAMLLAATYPERTSQLVLIGTYARFASADDYPWGVSPDAWDVFVEGVAARWGQGVLASNFAPSVAGDPEFVNWWARYQRSAASPGTILRLLEAYPALDARHVLPSIQAPTLVLHRRDDLLVDVRHGRYLADHIPDARLVECEGADHLFFVGNTDDFLDEIEEFLTGVRHGPDVDRVLATVMFTDIVDSTRKAAEVGDHRWRELLVRHDDVVEREVERHRGRAIKSLGDGVMAAFDGPARAIRCGLAIRDAVPALGLTVRAGLHCGECEEVGEDLHGIAVNIAARVAAMGGDGEVLVSSTVRDLVAGTDLGFEDHGRHELRGVPGTWQLYRVV